MITININKYLIGSLVGCAICAATSCSDFNDYNETPVDNLMSGNQTLWENISQNSQLSDFAALLQRTGFQNELSNTRSYTVWAPVNGTFDVAAYQQLSDSLLLQQFVKSHVAEYSHVASGDLGEQRIHTLNEKSFAFSGNGSYTFGGKDIQQANLPSQNGLLHLLNGAAQFYPNLYEYLRMRDDIDMLRDYFMHYEQSVLDTKNSVKGPVIGGIQTYIDSVVVTSNSLTRRLNASLSNEDSTYTFLMPTDKAYQEMYDSIKPLYKFIAKTVVQDVASFQKVDDSKTITADLAQRNLTAAELSDSLTRRIIADNLVFSNNDGYNQWLIDDNPNQDTLRSTTRIKYSNPRDILEPMKEMVPMSNGYARVMDSLAFLPWETYNPMIEANPAYYAYSPIDTDHRNNNRFAFTTTNVRVPDSIAQKMFGPEETGFTYAWIRPADEFAMPDVYIKLPNVLSTTYKFYAVFLPWRVETSPGRYVRLGSNDKPNLLNFQVSYCGTNGKLATYSFSKKYLETGKSSDANPTTKKLNYTTAFYNDPAKVDTVYLGEFTFPVAYDGLGTDYAPNIHISSPLDTFSDDDMTNYTGDIRLKAIIMKPVELVEYEENNK